LIRRFADLPFAVPLSARFQIDQRNYKDKATGRNTLKFWVDRLDWETDTELSVKGGGAAAMQSGDAGKFTVVWKHGEWKVESYKGEVRY
jgi:hypothetical protein